MTYVTEVNYTAQSFLSSYEVSLMRTMCGQGGLNPWGPSVLGRGCTCSWPAQLPIHAWCHGAVAQTCFLAHNDASQGCLRLQGKGQGCKSALRAMAVLRDLKL